MKEANLIINGEDVPFDTIKQEAERMRPHYDRMVRERNRASSDDELYEWAKENVIESTLLKQEAGKRYADDKQQDHSRLIGKLIDEVTKGVDKPTEAELRKIYDDNKSMFVSPEQVHASHIVKHVKAGSDKAAAFIAASEAKKALDGGEDFQAVAGRLSDCPSNGGDLGVFPRGQMVQEFEDVVFEMNPGEVSDVFLTDFGYHIAKLHKKLPSQPVKFEQVKAGIMQQVIQERKQIKLNQFVDELKEKAEIQEI